MLSSKLQARVSLIEKSILMINTVSVQLKFRCLPLNELLDVLCNDNSLSELAFLNDCRKSFQSGDDFDFAWSNSLKDFKGALKEEDKQLIDSFGSKLGKSDVDSQIGICELHALRLSERLSDAREEKDKYAKLYYKLGFLAGIFIIILLI